MKKIYLFILSFLCLTLLIAPACKPGKQVVGLGQEFQLSVGRQAFITGEDLGIEFVRVTQDSRCPTGAVCIQAGQAVCVVHLIQASSVYEVSLTETGGSPQDEQYYLGYHFIFNVLPYPEAGKDIRFENYRLVLKVVPAD